MPFAIGKSRASHTAPASFSQRGYSNKASTPARQMLPNGAAFGPDQMNIEEKDQIQDTAAQNPQKLPSNPARGLDTQDEVASRDGSQQRSNEHEPYSAQTPHSDGYTSSPLVQKLLDLEYEALSSERAWLLWEEINAKHLISDVPMRFIANFAGALVNAAQGTSRLPSTGEPDPRLQRLDSLLYYLSTSHRRLGNSATVKIASVRVQRALLDDRRSIEDARAELDILLSYEPLDTPGFSAAVFRAIRMIVQVQTSLIGVSEIVIDYWDAVHSVLIRNAGFTDRAPGAFHEASSLRSAVWKSLSGENNLWLWFSDRFSHLERSQGQCLALLVLAFAADSRLARETANAYDLVSKLGVVVPSSLLQNTIQVLIENEYFATALTALDVDGRNPSHRKTHFRLRMRLAAAMGDTTMAENVYKLMNQLQLADHIDQLLLLQADAKHGNTERVVARFNEFFSTPSSKSTPKPNIYHYSTVISAFARSGDEVGASQWIKRMAKSGIPPDAPLYNMILRTFALRNDITSVAGVLKRMHKLGIKRDKRTITTLVSMYARRGDPESAERVVRSALAMPGFTPDRQLLNSLLSAHVNAASWHGVIRVFDWMISMKSFNLRPEIDTMNNVLKAYVYMGAPFSTVSRTFEKIKKFGLRPNARSYLMLIQSACDIGNMDAAWDAFNELERMATKQFNPVNVYILTLMMGGYLRNGDKTQAKTIYEEMQARGIQPSAVSFRVILSAYSNEHTEESLTAAEHFMASLLESSPRDGEGWRKATTVRGDPVMTIFAPLLVAHGRSLHPFEVEAKFRTMLELGAEPTIESFTLLMDAYRRVGEIDSVTEAWEQLYKLAVKDHHAEIEPIQKPGAPALVTRRRSNVLCIALSIYIDALSHAGRHQDIARAWQTAKEDGFAFDSHNWNHLAIALVRAGEPERAFEIVERVLIPYSEYSDRAIRARNRTPPSLLTEEEATTADKQGGETKVVKPRERKRVMRSLIDRGVDSMLEEEETDPTDMVQSLHILHQISPGHNLWTPHERTLVELAAAARRLKRGLLVTARGPTSHEASPDNDVHSDAAYTILDRIKRNSPTALHASLTAMTKVRSYVLDERETDLTSAN
ncbi:pentatricopeptide repeat-containing protein 5, mitochondrial [Ceratobasidium sp. AG-Ba]|nr:pentatricopeptide repeat-containing protein 5, mitochondrial [Ceratobasidium sp. AG-Ba]